MLELLRPRYWVGHLAMMVCVGIAAGLGVWQLDAWQTRRDDAARDLSDAKPVALDTVMTGDSPFPGKSLGRPVSFDGEFLGDNIYVADRYVDGDKGYWVVTPVVVDGADSAIAVVRGWSPQPDVPRVTGPVGAVGWLQATEGSGGVDDDPQDDVIPAMRIASLVEKVDADLYSGFVVAELLVTPDGNGNEGLRPVTPDSIPEVSGFTALRNLLYGLEWFVFGAFALFIWVRWCRDTLNPPAPDEVDVEETDDEPAPA